MNVTLKDRLRRAVASAQRNEDYAMVEIYRSILSRIAQEDDDTQVTDAIQQLQRMSEDYSNYGRHSRAMDLVERINYLQRFIGFPAAPAVVCEAKEFMEAHPSHTKDTLREHLCCIFRGYEHIVDSMMPSFPESSFRDTIGGVK
jgi:cell fate (sporulation/competence/biofilm development) regulator YmcA (YheA/YmcA/DUF963 family)